MASSRIRNILEPVLRTYTASLIIGPSRLGANLPHALHAHQSYLTSSTRTRCISTQSLPTIVQPSFWKSLVPKALRSRSAAQEDVEASPKKAWNPATFFIVISLLIGSQAVQNITLKQNHERFSQQTESRLALLREVVKRIRNGEDVDVEGTLGTGDKAKEREWEEVMRELEEEDIRIRSRRRPRKEKDEVSNGAQQKADG